MAKRKKKEKKFYTYECTLSGDKFKRTTKVEKTDDLVSVSAYYEMNPELDDRPLVIKKQLGVLEKEEVEAKEEKEEE